MAIKYVDPKVAAWAVRRQDALLKAEQMLSALVKLQALSVKCSEGGRLSPSQKAMVRQSNIKMMWNKANKIVTELEATHSKRWDRSKV